MKRTNLVRIAVALFLVGALAIVWGTEGVAQMQPGENPTGVSSDGGSRTSQVDLFGGSAYTGGYLKYSYKVSREGVEGYSITTTEIIPEADGMYRIESSSTNIVPLDSVTISFFGIPLRGLGFRVPTSTGGTVDLSPLSAIENEILEPNREYVLPDGGFLLAGDAGTIAGIDVVYAVYTHASFTNVRVNLAMPMDLSIRNLLPLFPFLQLEYASDESSEDSTDAVVGEDHDYQQMKNYSLTELVEFIYEP